MLCKEKEIKYLYLQGGFGNILFQLVAYYSLIGNGFDCRVITLLTERNFFTRALGWTIHDKSFTKLIKEIYVPTSKFSFKQNFYYLFAAKVSQITGRKIMGVYFFNGDQNILKAARINFGYYQDKNFLLDHKKYILKIGESLNLFLENKDKKLNTDIAVHIRLGDSEWAKSNSDYYDEVIRHLEELNEPFTVITDSISEAKKRFVNFKNVNFESNTPLDDFSLLLSAKTIFAAPSTFSYWASVANPICHTVYLPRFIFEKFGFPYESKVKII